MGARKGAKPQTRIRPFCASDPGSQDPTLSDTLALQMAKGKVKYIGFDLAEAASKIFQFPC